MQRKQMQPNKQLETDKLRQRESANKAGLWSIFICNWFTPTVTLEADTERPMFPSDIKESADLQNKSTDWFLHGGNIGQ